MKIKRIELFIGRRRYQGLLTTVTALTIMVFAGDGISHADDGRTAGGAVRDRGILPALPESPEDRIQGAKDLSARLQESVQEGADEMDHVQRHHLEKLLRAIEPSDLPGDMPLLGGREVLDIVDKRYQQVLEKADRIVIERSGCLWVVRFERQVEQDGSMFMELILEYRLDGFTGEMVLGVVPP